MHGDDSAGFARAFPLSLSAQLYSALLHLLPLLVIIQTTMCHMSTVSSTGSYYEPQSSIPIVYHTYLRAPSQQMSSPRFKL